MSCLIAACRFTYSSSDYRRRILVCCAHSCRRSCSSGIISLELRAYSGQEQSPACAFRFLGVVARPFAWEFLRHCLNVQ
eukprot:IDg5022t1